MFRCRSRCNPQRRGQKETERGRDCCYMHLCICNQQNFLVLDLVPPTEEDAEQLRSQTVRYHFRVHSACNTQCSFCGYFVSLHGVQLLNVGMVYFSWFFWNRSNNAD